jgi:hypothetical protein
MMAKTTVQPLRRDAAPRRWVKVGLAGGLGDLAVVIIYFAIQSRLPGSIPSHYAANGTVDSMLSPEVLVGSLLVLNGFVTLVLMGLVRGIERSEVLEFRYGPWLLGPMTGRLAVLAALMIPVPSVLLLLGPAGLLPTWAPPIAVSTLAIALAPLLIFLLLLIRSFAQRSRPTDDRPASPRVTGRTAENGPVFLCSACGQRFVRSTWILLAPRVGFSVVEGGASYYLRCPICGERGWDPRVGWDHGVSPTPPGSSGSEATATTANR